MQDSKGKGLLYTLEAVSPLNALFAQYSLGPKAGTMAPYLGPRCFDGEFDSCAVYSHVTLLREGACTSSISADNWDDWFAG